MIFKINNLQVELFLYKTMSDSIDKDEAKVKNIYVSKEYYNKKDDQYKYNYFILKNIDELEQVTKTNNNIYEILQHNKPIKPYIDIDLYLNEYNFIINKDELLNNILDEYYKLFLICFKIKIQKKDFVIIDGTTTKKISFHIIINNNSFFVNNLQQKEYIKHIQSINNIVFQNCITFNKILDNSVYNKNKKFRLVNQAKLKSNEH